MEVMITSAIVLLGLHFIFQMRALWVNLVCVRGGCNNALCIVWQRSQNYIDPVGRNTP